MANHHLPISITWRKENEKKQLWNGMVDCDENDQKTIPYKSQDVCKRVMVNFQTS